MFLNIHITNRFIFFLFCLIIVSQRQKCNKDANLKRNNLTWKRNEILLLPRINLALKTVRKKESDNQEFQIWILLNVIFI